MAVAQTGTGSEVRAEGVSYLETLSAEELDEMFQHELPRFARRVWLRRVCNTDVEAAPAEVAATSNDTLQVRADLERDLLAQGELIEGWKTAGKMRESLGASYAISCT